jgi:hypothetical protein
MSSAVGQSMRSEVMLLLQKSRGLLAESLKNNMQAKST